MATHRLEKQVCTPAQAKRLRELGVPQNSYFWLRQHQNYVDFGVADWGLLENGLLKIHTCFDEQEAPVYAAFNAAELADMLPDTISGGYDLELRKNGLYNG